jgi:hypothetical protein
LWYADPNTISYAKFYSPSEDAVIRVYDAAGNVIETHEHLSVWGAVFFDQEIGWQMTNAVGISSARTIKRFPNRAATKRGA